MVGAAWIRYSECSEPAERRRARCFGVSSLDVSLLEPMRLLFHPGTVQSPWVRFCESSSWVGLRQVRLCLDRDIENRFWITYCTTFHNCVSAVDNLVNFQHIYLVIIARTAFIKVDHGQIGSDRI